MSVILLILSVFAFATLICLAMDGYADYKYNKNCYTETEGNLIVTYVKEIKHAEKDSLRRRRCGCAATQCKWLC